MGSNPSQTVFNHEINKLATENFYFEFVQKWVLKSNKRCDPQKIFYFTCSVCCLFRKFRLTTFTLTSWLGVILYGRLTSISRVRFRLGPVWVKNLFAIRSVCSGFLTRSQGLASESWDNALLQYLIHQYYIAVKSALAIVLSI